MCGSLDDAYNELSGRAYRSQKRLIPRTPLPRRDATYLTATIVFWAAVWLWGTSALASVVPGAVSAEKSPVAQETSPGTAYQGKMVLAVELPGVAERDRDHLVDLLPQK